MSGASDPFLLYLRCSLFGLQSLGPTDGGMMPLPTSTYLWPFANASRSASKVGTCWVFGFWVHWVRKHCVAIHIYVYTRTLYIYLHIYIYDIFIYNTFTKYTYLYRYTIKHIDRYNRFIQMHREIKSNVQLAMAPSNENKPGSCEHGQGACPATWQSFQGHCALATIFLWMLGTDNDWDIYGYPMENWMMFRGFRFKPRLGLSKQFSDVTWYNMV